MAKAHVLLIEDDNFALQPLINIFEKHEFRVSTNVTGKDVLEQVRSSEPKIDVVLCDIALPYSNGLAIARDLSQCEECGVILLSVSGSEDDRILGLKHGADDYVIKPANPMEVFLRTQALIRRKIKAESAVNTDPHFFNLSPGFKLHQQSKVLVRPDKSKVQLTDGENCILLFLMSRSGKICSREQLSNQVRGKGVDWTPEDRSIDVLIGRLRRKLKGDSSSQEILVTVRHKGYMLVAG